MPEIASAWRALLEISDTCRAAGERPAFWRFALPGGDLRVAADGTWSAEPAPSPPLAAFLDLYLPYCLAPAAGFAAAHLGQSLDGRIATAGGASRWITGEADVVHNHRMRALADAVLVGAATVRCDDPQLTVRSCSGRNPVRVILDTERSLGPECRMFRDGAAPTLVLAAADRVAAGGAIAGVELLALPREGGAIAPKAIRQALAARGLSRLFVEGGGVTVSRFLAAGCLDRLQITVSPLILGSGRPGIVLPEIASVAEALRPRTRRFELGDDILFECIFRD